MPTDAPSIEVLFSAERIAGEINTLAQRLKRDLPSDILVVAVLKGSFIFVGDLLRAMHREGCALMWIS